MRMIGSGGRPCPPAIADELHRLTEGRIDKIEARLWVPPHRVEQIIRNARAPAAKQGLDDSTVIPPSTQRNQTEESTP